MVPVARSTNGLLRPKLGLADRRGDAHIIVASNRGPLEFQLDSEGRRQTKAASGGVVTALSGLARHLPFTWVASASTQADQLAARDTEAIAVKNARLRFVLLSSREYHCHYNLYSNPLLWFVQHSLSRRLSRRTLMAALSRGWANGYVPANAAFARAIAAAARDDGRSPIVLLHDYHLYLTAAYLRGILPGALLQHFVHIPWPHPREWLPLPAGHRRALLLSLLHNDILGLQTNRCVAEFLRSCAAFVPQARVDRARAEVTLDGHKTLVRAYPISIDLTELRDALGMPGVIEYERQLRGKLGELTIVRVDRLDPSKDVANGFRAYERLLEVEPEWQGRVRFLAYLVPSRCSIPEYRSYAEETFDVARRVNARFGRGDYQPIEIFHENNRPQALAGLKHYDVLLVNSLADGMNLVAKEGCVANERDGVLILSTGTGAHEQLRRGALSVMPGEVAGIAAALSRALRMPPEERAYRATLLREIVQQHDVVDWAAEQLDDLLRLMAVPMLKWA